MSELSLSQAPDEDLVEAARTQGDVRQKAAFDELYRRNLPILKGVVYGRTRAIARLLANTAMGSLEDFVGDVLGRAICDYRRDGGAQFRTYACRILVNAMTSGIRRKVKLVGVPVDEDGEPREDRNAAPVIPPGSMAHVTLIEVLEIATAALKALRESDRVAFVWMVLLDFSGPQLQDLYPDRKPDAIRKLKERATAAFFEEWQRRGGTKAEAVLSALGPAMSERLDPEKIKDPAARAAYRAWLTGDLAAAAKASGLGLEETRALLLSAAHDLYRQATLRGRGKVLAQVLDIGGAAEDPLLARARRTIALVRAAFGVAPLEAAFTTLGAFVQARLRTADECESARKALRLTPSQFRRLLSDELKPDAALLKRLAEVLEVPAQTLKALPATPLGGPDVVTRGAEGLDRDRVRERAMQWIRGRRA
ncbi:MAG: hypothetical protein IT452_09795 [Planctomycetia bacterium]|nr:hypothetical protein [Planctomycetia bacterium]